MTKTTTRASRFFVHCPFLYECNMKILNFTFYGVLKQAITKFYFLSELGYGP